jgi:hypothetical protein
MTIARRASRTITVDGVDYRWTVRRRPFSGTGPVTFAVEAAESPGTTLVVRFRPPRPDASQVPPDPVRPAVVAQRIRDALSTGWQPGSPGVPFLVREA